MLKFYIFVIISILFNILSNYFLKKGALVNTEEGMIGLININLLIGLSILGLAFVTYYIALSKLNINIVYPTITAFSIIGVTIISHFIFNEPLSIENMIIEYTKELKENATIK